MTFSKGRRRSAVAVALVLAAGGLAFVPASAHAQPSAPAPVVETFGNPGLTEFTVPAGVDQLTVEAIGAGGGGGGGGRARDDVGARGGSGGGGGARVRCQLPVSPGQMFNVVVGKGGAGGKPDLLYGPEQIWERATPGAPGSMGTGLMAQQGYYSPINFSTGVMVSGGVGGDYALDHRTALGSGGGFLVGAGNAGGNTWKCAVEKKKLPPLGAWAGSNGGEGHDGSLNYGGAGGSGGLPGDFWSDTLPRGCPFQTVGRGAGGGKGAAPGATSAEWGGKGGDGCVAITYTPAP
ncbi:glycine-rich domain-containing protein [Streptomyces lydicamycinicus]